MRHCLTILALATLASLLPARPCGAAQPPSIIKTGNADTASGVNIGGLSLAPDAFRYRPQRNTGMDWSTDATRPALSNRLQLMADDLPGAYVADRGSFLNSIRARRGLALLTFWENADRCLFFGLNSKGQAGVSFVPTRKLRQASRSGPRSDRLYALYAQLMNQPREVFPQPPRAFD